MKKKGQGGMNAALLVAIIAGLIILYILFLPENQKRELLGEKPGGGQVIDEKEHAELLSEGRIQIDPLERIESKLIPNVYLIENVNAKKITDINPFVVRDGWFDKEDKITEFRVDENLEDIDNIVLSFSARKRKGNLIIKLNDESIYEYQPNRVNIVVELEKGLLEKDNKLEFGVSGVGLAFWKTNEYDIENVQIFGDITDRSRQASQNIFELTGAEYKNLKRATLDFVPYCSRIMDVGVLNVLLNNRNVYSAVPVCDDLVRIPVKEALYEGENKVIFRTERGSYSIEQIKVNLEGKAKKSLSYYFQVSDEQYKDIRDESHAVNLSIDFVDDDEDKRAVFSVNRRKRTIDQRKPDYDYDISTWIDDGNNYLEITPRTTLKIVDLRVIFYER